jgi:hypothetical protein
MKQTGKSRGHTQPRKQSMRLPTLILKHSFLSRSKERLVSPKQRRAAS